MITRSQIDQLLEFHDGECLITSCYLRLDRAKMPAQMLKIRAKDLLRAAEHDLQTRTANHAQRESLRRDFELIDEYVMGEILGGRHKALAVFSCSAHKFWQSFGLPHLTRNVLVADKEAYTRPLTALLAEHQRFCTVVVDHALGRLFEVYMGAIRERSGFIDQVPRRSRDAGFGGREERSLARRHDQAVRAHYQHLADTAFALFKRDQFDRLVLGGRRDTLAAFKASLHPYLRERWAGDFDCDPLRVTPVEVLDQTNAVERRLEAEGDERMVDDLLRRVEAGDRGVVGLPATLGALLRGEAQTLLVDEGFAPPGFVCPVCHQVSLEAATCPTCQRAMESSPDVIDAMVDLAAARHCDVRQLVGASRLEDRGHIGAVLRFQTGVAASA